MQTIFDTYKKTKNLHHAYFIEGNKETVYLPLVNFVEKELGIVVVGNPDVWFGEFEKIGIDEGHLLRTMQGSMAVSGNKRIFIVIAEFITREAQNALLKVFEEPNVGVHFFIIMPSSDVLLPTLKSRMVIVKNEDKEISCADEKMAAAFFNGNVQERVELLAPIIESKNKTECLNFINALEMYVQKQKSSELGKYKEVIADTVNARRYLRNTAPSVKNILEHFIIAVPRG
jgi:DNA polymerase-3 subunit delta'